MQGPRPKGAGTHNLELSLKVSALKLSLKPKKKKKKKNYIVNANKCFINFLTVISIKFSNSLRDAHKLTSLAARV